MSKAYCVYILSSYSKTLYIGVTSNLEKRVYEHKIKVVDGFSKLYNVNKLVDYEVYDDPVLAIAREKQLKTWRRNKKVFLIERKNPYWKELKF